MATIGEQQLNLSDDYAEALDMLSNRSVDNTKAALARALKRTLRDLRRYYSDFINPELKRTESADGVMRRPMAYSIADSNAKLTQLLKIAQSYFPEEDLQRIATQYKKDFAEAIKLGGDLGAELAQLISPENKGNGMFVGASKEAVAAVANTASAYIRREVETFRDDIARIVADGVGRGKGSKALEKDIRVALMGAKDPNNITPRLGLMRRAELIARSELANAYTNAQKQAAQRNGYKYGRFIATQDERTCQYCASRHGRIYLLSEMTGTLHPRCRCSLSPVSDLAVEETDPDLRRELLREDFWEQERNNVWKKFAEAKEWPFDKASKILEDHLKKPSASEKRLYPDIKEAPRPVV
jgi:SPP1 gp7 family putative phage head morphogenesis protein